MTETDATNRPVTMPEKFIPYMEKYRLYRLFKDMAADLVVHLPKDHIQHMKIFLSHRLHCPKDTDRIMLLVSPELKIDIQELVKELIKSLGFIAITRRYIMDRYEKNENCETGCISAGLVGEVTKQLTMKDPVPHVGWIMFDHPCTVTEARYMQLEGVLPTVTLALLPPPPVAPQTYNPLTHQRDFNKQDFEGLINVFKATLKTVYIEEDTCTATISKKCFNAIAAATSGAQCPGVGFHVEGAPSVYRVLIIGPVGSGRLTQTEALAKHFGLVFVNFESVYEEAKSKDDDIGKKLRSFGPSVQLKAEIIRRRLMQKDCLEQGFALAGYPMTGFDFENLDNMPTPPNRIIFLSADWDTCRQRMLAHAVDWCTGEEVDPDSGPRAMRHPTRTESVVDNELEMYFSEHLAELRAAAGITAVEINALDSFDAVQTKLQAAVIASPVHNIYIASKLQNVKGE